VRGRIAPDSPGVLTAQAGTFVSLPLLQHKWPQLGQEELSETVWKKILHLANEQQVNLVLVAESHENNSYHIWNVFSLDHVLGNILILLPQLSSFHSFIHSFILHIYDRHSVQYEPCLRLQSETLNIHKHTQNKQTNKNPNQNYFRKSNEVCSKLEQLES
jgi:hypothetical protein